MSRGSPWIEQLTADTPPQPLDHDVTVDVAIVGAGIAGVATAFFALQDTTASVLLIEAGRAGHGATGHNAGQLTTYFERPLPLLVAMHGVETVIAAQREIDESWDLLDTLHTTCGATMRIDRFTGYLGMFALNHVLTHLEECRLRRDHGLRVPTFMIADDAEFVAAVPSTYDTLYDLVPRARVQQLLETGDDRYCAVMSTRSGCANGALLVEQVLAHLRTAAEPRFRFVDHTAVEQITLEAESAVLRAGGHRVTAAHVVLCTNGFADHIVDNRAGPQISHRTRGTVGYMAGFLDTDPRPAKSMSFIRNAVIGESTPYVYFTRRPYDSSSGQRTLTCIGGPEEPLGSGQYDAHVPVPAHVVADLHGQVMPMVKCDRASGDGFDYAWHGLMGYTPNGLRAVGFEPANRVLLYNLGCNGVGFLPSIHGGHRVARLLRGDALGPSLFDPP